MKKDVVLWTHIPSHHTIGPFRELANSRNVYCMCRKATSKLRGDIWKTPDFGALGVEYLLEKDDVKASIDDFLDKTSDAVHFVAGFGDLPEFKLFWKGAKKRKINPIVIAERPNPQRSALKSFLRDAYYSYVVRSLSSTTGAALCMGKIGVDAYRALGLSDEKTLPYMYTNGLPFPELPEKIEIGTPLRFVYVGGDEKWRKGLDVLTEALRGFTPEQLTFDMIGIGPDSWVADFARENALDGVIRPLGKMQSDEIAPKLARDYDVLVLSSRHDGWGMTVSEAVLSGIGALVTDRCASRDVVEASGAGRVMTAGSVESTRAAIRLCVDSPETARAWKEKARAYRDDLRPEKLAGYLEETVEYVESRYQAKKPNPYWLNPR